MRYLIGMIMGGFGGWLGGYWLVMSRLEGQGGLALLIGTQAAPTAPDTILCMAAGAALGIGLAWVLRPKAGADTYRYQPHPPPGGEVLRPKAGADTYRYPAVLRPKAGADNRPREYANAGPRNMTGVVEALMRAGTTPLGTTPLHRVVKHNPNPAMVAAFIEAGANIDARNESGKTPLHYAARYNPNPAVIAALIEAGADIRARDKAGKLPFDDAKHNDNKTLQRTDVYSQLRRALVNEDHEAPIVGR